MRILALFVGIGGTICAQDAPDKTQTGALVANVISVGVTRIEQPPTASTKLYRDGLGRIREELISIAPSGARTVSMVMISDPIGEFHYTLDLKNKVAHRVKVKAQKPAAGQARPPMGPSGPNTTREPLGVQFLNGVEARGELVRMTIAAGLVGNDRPIVETTELWTSTELNLTIRQVIRSPLRGVTTIEMLNVTRVEPDPLLFSVPPDYQIVDDKGPYTIGR